MVPLAFITVIIALIFGLKHIPIFRSHPEIAGGISGGVLFTIIYLLGMNDPWGGSILLFNFATLMIPALIAQAIDSTGKLDVPFIFSGALIEFLLLGYLIGKFMGSYKKS